MFFPLFVNSLQTHLCPMPSFSTFSFILKAVHWLHEMPIDGPYDVTGEALLGTGYGTVWRPEESEAGRLSEARHLEALSIVPHLP